MTRCFLFSCLAVGVAAADASTDALQGTWNVVSAERDGTADESVLKDVFTFAGDTIRIGRGGGVEEGTFQLDPAAKPKTIDIRPRSSKDRPVRGIYEIKGDTLKLCVARPGTDRPTEFQTKAGSRHRFAELKRAKPEGTPSKPTK